MDEILGLPIHPLLVHAPVILVPALIVGAVCYVVVSKLRQRIGWAVMALSVLAPLSTLGAWWSGHRFYDLHVEMIGKAGADPSKFRDLLAAHLGYGDILIWLVPALSIAVWTLGYLNRRNTSMSDTDTAPRSTVNRVVMVALAAAVLGLSGAAGYYTFQSGHSGAEVVWGQENK